jgi:aspartyl-tRNA(Asn)/glutamyl-tRNA(Gln) amidotransferase subunit B
MQICGLEVDPIIGLEVHVQLRTRTKMFCGCAVEFGAPPNSRVCPVCLGLPGALPVINRAAVELAVRAGLALNCSIARATRWDRKSYFYPDLPKNYQISQYEHPLCLEGYFELPLDHAIRRVRIRRAHLEEDAGKNVHDWPGITAVDLNRAGTPLLEIVTEPDLRSAGEAREFAVQLQRLMRYLGLSEADMQKGQMRFEPNINVRIRRDQREYLTPIVEVKNLNSFRSLQAAIEYEIRRQVEAWLEDGRTAVPGNKSNRGWDDVQLVTVPQREKEEAHDYRYFPDPDLVPLTVDPAWVEELRASLPELPIPRTERFVREYGLAPRDAAALVDDRATADLLDHAARYGGDRAILARHFLSFWSMLAHQRATTIAGLGLPPAAMAELAELVRAGEINATAAARIAEQIVERVWGPLTRDASREPQPAIPEAVAPPRPYAGRMPPSPRVLAAELGLLQTRDADQIAAWVEQAMAANAQAVRDAMINPKKIKAARGFLAGQVMKLSGGRADPQVVAALLEQRLRELGEGMA